ncbi:unnamed protein product [Gongylonema pulchrum]|uniref:Uncharacterized protein n=1 Tax=Gongylonema pulchrum TaxID=637853 RepID=A0A183F1A3_9BILA|nr:unnamed protein product [Gongylonema pulchrum]
MVVQHYETRKHCTGQVLISLPYTASQNRRKMRKKFTMNLLFLLRSPVMTSNHILNCT